MAHYFLMAIMPKQYIRFSRKRLIKKLGDLLKPYDENLEVIPYETDCWCIQNENPNKNCKKCNGTGKATCTYNPNSKWNWWQIGGRWTGIFVPEYSPQKDKRNIKTCNLCKGIGKQITNLNNRCNYCNGKGQVVKHSTEFAPFNKDVMPIEKIPEHVVPFAIITPDGRWAENARVEWQGNISKIKDKQKWENIVKNIKAEYQNCIAVVVDCHI